MFTLIVMLCLGSWFLFIGWRIWKKEQITLIHQYHYTKVSDHDKKPYTEMMGKACIVIGIGIFLSAIVDFITNTSYGWICFGVCFIVGFGMIIKAQKKYNGGVF